MPDLPTGSITFLLTDVEGSTKLWEQHPEAMDAALGRHNALAAAIVHHQGGTLVKQRGEGDSLFAVFARATDALVAAATLQRAFCSEPWPAETPLRVRMALHTGDVALREGDYYGTAVNRCARLRAVAHGGQVLLSQTTCDLVQEHLPADASLRDLGSHRLKDLQQPERIFRLLHPDLPTDFPPLRSLEAFAHNLPAQLTSFIGREAEMAEVKQLLGATRLLTLTGSGGCGKTRLGLQVAADLIDGFESGVFFVNLAPVRDPGLVASAVAQTLGIRERVGQPLLATLTESLREKHLLLLLDNFEHVLAAAPLVADLLAATPRVRVMITSRAVLHLRGEKEFPVPPLALPDLRQWSMVDGRWLRVSGQTPQPPTNNQQPSTILQYPAVELFIERALDVKSDFQVTSENTAAVAEICCYLDGLPLAIELAARRVKLFTPQALLARLGSRLKLLVGGARDLPARQQTLRNTIAWSYDLLDECEKRLFRRLSVFVGGCTLEATEAICSDGEVAEPGTREGGGSGETLSGDAGILPSTASPPRHLAAGDILDLLASLVDKSLVRREEGEKGEPRFGMLETIREFALECLIASAEAASSRYRHAHHFLALGGQVVNLTRAEQEEWLEQLVRDQNNLRAALDWFEADDGGAETGLWLMWGLWRLWVAQGYVSEGRERLSRLLALAAPAPTSPRAAGLTLGGVLARIQLDYGSARSLLQEALVIWRELDDQPDVALTLINLGLVAVEQGDYEQAAQFSAEALTLSQALKSEWLTAFSLYAAGFQSYARGDLVLAAGRFCESVALYRTQGEEWLIVMPLLCLGKIACHHSNYQQADVHFRESLEFCQGVRDKSFVAPSLEGLAEVARAQGQVARATRLCGAAEALRDALGLPVPQIDQAMYTMNLSSLRAAVGAPSFVTAWAEGRAMPLEVAIKYAREV